ncbi:Permease of the drug/metabolite transporter (DMT) superfamily [Cupriavidus sp. YR651]|uniref:DMT family transporter n=1 Tax=Cupriavidus sp. YR651 TaxID=1855315 RepID=UPI00088053A2|nr:DMT family transporter [Cupriavidus sp. YR651]SDD52114.1 Permease of the drug/metabolite transporter (DMT) superfamily [Cupriavidus sp. YR651]
MSRPLPAWLPGLAFVLIWSTGFIVGKAVVPVADTNRFLLARFGLAAVMFGVAAMAGGARWPALREVPRHLIAGALMQGIYLCAGYGAVAHGLSPSVMALLGALQPLLTALLAIPLLKELPSPRTWRGLALGAFGVGLVVVPAMRAGAPNAVSPWIVLIGVLAILSITMGTLLQKTSISRADIRTSSAWQNTGAMLVAGILVCATGDVDTLRWTPGLTLWASLGWAAFVLSGAGTWLLLGLVRRGQAANAAALMFLAPPLAAVQAALLFGDHLGPVQWIGMAVAGAGVWLCQTQGRLRHAPAR